MRKIFIGLLAFIFAAVSIESAVARSKDKPNYGFCQSGKKVGNIKNCKENGGTK